MMKKTVDEDRLLLAEINEYTENFMCPITKTLQVNPVIIESGHSFDRTNIKHWFEHNDTCPTTGIIVNRAIIIPNYNLQSSISFFVDKYTDKEGEDWEEIRDTCRVYKEERRRSEEREIAARLAERREAERREAERQRILLDYERTRAEEILQQAEFGQPGRSRAELTQFIQRNGTQGFVEPVLEILERNGHSSYRHAMSELRNL
jgi:hypothetical protein